MMIRLILALALTGCAAGSDSTGTVAGPQDLSGYATVEDLDALQEQLDEQAAALATLQATLANQGGPRVEQVTAVCVDDGSGGSLAALTFAEHVQIVQVSTCAALFEGGSRCIGPDPTGIGLYEYSNYDVAQDGALASMRVQCDLAGDTVWIAYLVTD